ncbi:MAG: hypothetical protein MUO68_12715 [Desulfobacteraceae bacterium]|nr:hypothetical protein [Desulfobacteraceae bacterium]
MIQRGVETLFLTHAHIDHSGKIPKLVKDGFQGRIITSPPTAELCEIMLLDAAHIQEMDAEWQSKKNKRQNRGEIDPLYTIADAEATLGRLHPVKISWKKWSKTSRTNTMLRTPRYNGCAKSPRMNMLSVPALKLTPWPRSWASRLPKGKYATLAGFLLEKEGEIPPPGTLIRVKGISFTIESSNPQAIQEVYVRW